MITKKSFRAYWFFEMLGAESVEGFIEVMESMEDLVDGFMEYQCKNEEEEQKVIECLGVIDWLLDTQAEWILRKIINGKNRQMPISSGR
ncbi:MAG: hypothetical protein DWQ07_12285 [Chloroflexi bacterium]|nr:MAG: hypothetical protein DWQ07_12285 [Chloroflexota bacterium]